MSAVEIIHGADTFGLPALVDRAALQREKDTWIVNARAGFVADTREECAVCGFHKESAHAHHSFPLSLQFDRGLRQPIHEHDWLCPTHHSIIHAAIRYAIGVTKRFPAIDNLSIDDQEHLLSLLDKFAELQSDPASFMRRKGDECLAEANILDELYAAVIAA